MTDKEREALLKIIEQYKLKLKGDKVGSRNFLVKAGIYTEKGNLRKPYRNLCIQPDLA